MFLSTLWCRLTDSVMINDKFLTRAKALSSLVVSVTVVMSVTAITLIALTASAKAEIIFNFTVQVTDSKKDGSFKVVLDSRTFDSEGGKMEALGEIRTRLPYGMRIRSRGFPTCSVKKLEKTRDPKTCNKSRIGYGYALVDARPLFTEPIRSKVFLFLGKRPNKQSVASFVTLALPKSSNPLVSGTRPVLVGPVVNDPSPDGKFGYRMDQELSIETPFPDLVINVPEIKLTIKGMSRKVRKAKCLKRRGDKCVSKSSSKETVFLFSNPKCPPSKMLSFASQLIFKSSTLPLERETQVRCFKSSKSQSSKH